MGMDGTMRRWPIGAGERIGAREEIGDREDGGAGEAAVPSDMTGFRRAVVLAAAGIVALATVVAIGTVAAGAPHRGTVDARGWVSSYAGSYAPDPELAGRAEFTVGATREVGGRISKGAVTFDLGGGAFAFASTSVDWMALSGDTVRMTGIGTVGGTGDYGFLLAARGSDTAPGLLLRVWDKATGVTVYDNQPVVPRASRNTRLAPIGGGSIEIQEFAAPPAANSSANGRATRPVVRWR